MSTDINLRSSYVRYKKNTGQLVRWLVSTVSHVAPKQAAPSSDRSKSKKGGGKKGGQKQTLPPSQLPATIDEPVISIRSFTEYATLIASANPKVNIPPAVYSLFDSVIHARRMVASFYHRLEMDIDVEAKNESHMAFIQALEAAFDILGGTNWREARNKEEKERREKDKAEGAEVEEEDPLKLSNRFAELEVSIHQSGNSNITYLSNVFRLKILTSAWRSWRLHPPNLVKRQTNGLQILLISPPEKARRTKLHNRLGLLKTLMLPRKQALLFGAFLWMLTP